MFIHKQAADVCFIAHRYRLKISTTVFPWLNAMALITLV